MSEYDGLREGGGSNFNAAGLTALIVEDNPLLMLDLEHVLRLIGFTDVKLAPDVATGLAIVERGDAIDVAILEFALRDGPIAPLAELLQRHGTPFIIYSGHSADRIRQSYPASPFIAKPGGEDEFASVLAGVMTKRAGAFIAPAQVECCSAGVDWIASNV